MPKQIVIAEQHRIAAIFSEDRVEEVIVSAGTQQVGDIFVGTVENVIPGIDAAFVNIGDAERNGFIHVTDLGPLRLRRSAGAITELLSPSQKVLVQVVKEPTGNKGPRLTGNLSLPGRYLVLMPSGRGVNLSRRIESESERSRLRALAILIKPAGMGLLVRTEAEGQPEEAIMADLKALQQQWKSIQEAAAAARPPALLNRDDDFIQRVLRDLFTGDVNRIVVENPASVKRIKQQLAVWNGGRPPNGVSVDHHRDRLPILDYFRVNAAIREALKPRVDLPSGGYVVIEHTEALTVVDVNSGSFTRSATSRETVLWTNTEAATEIARQLRLRKIGGVIVVDFIDMDSRRDQLKVLEHFDKALKADKARPQIVQLSELGLVELTRKRQGQSLTEQFGQPCPTCGGLGHLALLPGENGQGESLVAPLAPLARSSERPSGRSSPSNEDLEAFFEVSAEDDDLDLTSHPNYQEIGSGNRRRRRRDGTRDGNRGKSRQGRDRKSPEPEKTLAPVVDRLPEKVEKLEPIETVEKTDKPEKTRSPKAPVPEREVQHIAVEMTHLEQEVYALMGLSPLVRMSNGNTVQPGSRPVVTVYAPGETPSVPVAVGAAVGGDEESRSFEPESEGTFEVASDEVSDAPDVPDVDNNGDAPEELLVITANSNHSAPSEATAVVAAASEETPEPASGTRIRRRRRRSSATNS
ncbi:ribonuclease, Rne/Rng family [Rubidibacter lacunae KORDI 51-2]|uniref:Ribonuclease, Rne/Rng family n=1 Tax=Rubidibacter lacunae KORDI 51-2 TaxID=582515 RepID=U5D768_9CHRO|nr:Rne/Rng family ribonuclease [Rubidibacter lacunae]ERN40488.1 ribonuclease, Rne/Rng family [Rubidibacter lacunae KORDI 51-2]